MGTTFALPVLTEVGGAEEGGGAEWCSSSALLEMMVMLGSSGYTCSEAIAVELYKEKMVLLP
jgi:hypothetical protein